MEMRFVAENLNVPGGPVVLPGGDVLVCEMLGGRLLRVRPDGTISVVAETGGAPTAAALGPEGAVYVCNAGAPRMMRETLPDGRTAFRPAPAGQSPRAVPPQIQRVTPKGKVSTLCRQCDGRPLMGPAGLVFDRAGNFYFADSGRFEGPVRDPGVSTESKHISVLRMLGAVTRQPAGSVYYASADGSTVREILHPIASPCGVGLAPDELTLYVAEAGTGRLWAFQLPAPGQIGKRRCLGVAPGARPLNFSWCEGLAVDAEGDVLTATVVNGGITTFSPHGRQIEHVTTGDPFTTALCFGGRDRRTLYVTLAGHGRLVAYDAWPTRGHVLNFAP
jgi:gluconolactonase